MTPHKTIQYTTMSRNLTYGNERAYVVNPEDAALIKFLTRKDTCPQKVRDAFNKLSDGAIRFELVKEEK